MKREEKEKRKHITREVKNFTSQNPCNTASLDKKDGEKK